MDEELKKLIESKFQVAVEEGEDKTCSLEEAIKGHVKEKMVINISAVGSLIYQLMREFWGRQPDFTFITQGIASHFLALIYGKLTRKILTTFAGISYPSPSPHPIVQKAYLSGEVEFENWTMRTIPQRLLAGAMGWGFIPTNSLLGSSMEEENRESFTAMDDPFSQEGRIGLLKALRPDITLLHGVAADRSGFQSGLQSQSGLRSFPDPRFPGIGIDKGKHRNETQTGHGAGDWLQLVLRRRFRHQDHSRA